MDTNAERELFSLPRGLHWWAIVIRGIVAILFGILALTWPGITLGVLLMLFGIFAFADGVMAIVFAFGSKEGRKKWWLLLLVGIVGILAGIITFSYPGITTLSLLLIIATWSVVTGLLHVISAISGTEEVASRWLWGLSGVLSMIFGILLYAYPVTGIFAVVWLIGFYALFFGFTLIVLGLQIKGFGEHLRGALQH